MPAEAAQGMLAWPHSGFHAHDGVWVPAQDRGFTVRLARCCARHLVALGRLTPTPRYLDGPLTELYFERADGNSYGLWRNFTGRVIFKTLQALPALQKDFFRSGAKESLEPATQRDLASKLKVTPSAVNRAIKNPSVRMPTGEEFPLSDFFRSRKQVERNPNCGRVTWRFKGRTKCALNN